jgi:predicted SprT family Zn-dependent metalloprotease
MHETPWTETAMIAQAKIDPLIQPYQAFLAEWTALWGMPELVDQVQIEISGRLRTSIGLCYPERSLIRLHPVLREVDESLFLEILCHELAHIAAHRKYGRQIRPHGRAWAELVETAGFRARARLPHGTIFMTPEQRATRKTVLWHHRCPRCNAARTARRPVYTWRCTTCRSRGNTGKLEIVREELRG